MRVNSDLRLTGEINAPRVEGDLGISTGQIDLDPILAQLGDSAYATKETEYLTNASDTKGPASRIFCSGIVWISASPGQARGGAYLHFSRLVPLSPRQPAAMPPPAPCRRTP